MDKQSALRAVLFDFDGTIIYLPTNYEGIRYRLEKLFLIFDIYSDFRPLVESIKCSLEELRRKESLKVVRQIEKQVFSIIEKEELQAVENSRIAEGAKEVLSLLRTSNIAIAVVSRNGRNCIERCFSRFKLPEPDLIVAREDVKELKPHPKQFKFALKKLKIAPSQAIIIGDSYHDIDGGKKLGIKTILVSQCEDNELKQQSQPEYKISSLFQFCTMIGI